MATRKRNLSVILAALVALTAVVFAPRTSFAQDKKVEAAAKALQKKAMEDDYLATEFAKAQDKLEKALASCGADKCSANLRALLHRDIGVVQIGGKIDPAKGQGHFVDALKLDGSVQLDPDLKTKELDTAWEAAKKAAAGGPGPGPGPGPSSAPPTGDFEHTPAAEQAYRTPVPIYVEYKGESKLVKVIARYKSLGMTEFKPVELKKMGETGWGGLVPCADVQVGTLQYYVQGFDANNDPVAVAGDRKSTYNVPIKRGKIDGEAPHLPNQPAPQACPDTGDCPPDFPGCKKGPGTGTEPTGKPDGEECDEDNECRSQTCSKKPNSSSGVCAPKEKKDGYKHFWVGVSGALDIAVISQQDDVCKLHPRDGTDKDKSALPVNEAGYYCVKDDGSDYPFRPPGDAAGNARAKAENDAIVVGKDSDKVRSSGTAIGNIRIMASFDYGVTPNILVGARAGVVLLTYPGEAAGIDGKRFGAPIHLEARGTYLIGKDALAPGGGLFPGFAPYVNAGLGISTFEAKVPNGVAVAEKVDANGKPDPTSTTEKSRQVEAWAITGPFFVTFGAGVRYAVTPNIAVMGGPRVNLAFGNTFLPTIGPELGAQFGF